LAERAGDDVEWQWICTQPPAHSLPESQLEPFRRLLHQLRSNKNNREKRPEVIKLRCIRKREAGELEGTCNPLLTPKGINSEDDLFKWVFSPEAGLFPPLDWYGNCQEAALLALAEKLLRNHSIASGGSSHCFTKQGDLLNQAPVNRARFPEIRQEAAGLLDRLGARLFLRKGAEQGNTPLEWAINSAFLPGLKRTVLARSLEPLEEYEELKAIVQRIRSDDNHSYRIDDEIISGRTINFCRENSKTRPQGNGAA